MKQRKTQKRRNTVYVGAFVDKHIQKSLKEYAKAIHRSNQSAAVESLLAEGLKPALT